MRAIFASVFAMSVFVASPSDAQDASNPVRSFLKAADIDDQPAMAALVAKRSSVSAAQLQKKTKGCYLRRVYGKDDGAIIAAWMCAEGASKSRVLLIYLTREDDGVSLVIASEQTNAIPAPPRSGSALEADK